MKNGWWVLEKLVLDNGIAAATVALLVFVIVFASIVWNLPLKLLFTIPAALYIRVRQLGYQLSRAAAGRDREGLTQRMTWQARALAAELANIEGRLNAIAAACSRVAAPDYWVTGLLLTFFDRSAVHGEVNVIVRRAVRNLNEEYYRTAALSEDEDRRASANLYVRWRGPEENRSAA